MEVSGPVLNEHESPDTGSASAELSLAVRYVGLKGFQELVNSAFAEVEQLQQEQFDYFDAQLSELSCNTIIHASQSQNALSANDLVDAFSAFYSPHTPRTLPVGASLGAASETPHASAGLQPKSDPAARESDCAAPNAVHAVGEVGASGSSGALRSTVTGKLQDEETGRIPVEGREQQEMGEPDYAHGPADNLRNKPEHQATHNSFSSGSSPHATYNAHMRKTAPEKQVPVSVHETLGDFRDFPGVSRSTNVDLERTLSEAENVVDNCVKVAEEMIRSKGTVQLQGVGSATGGGDAATSVSDFCRGPREAGLPRQGVSKGELRLAVDGRQSDKFAGGQEAQASRADGEHKPTKLLKTHEMTGKSDAARVLESTHRGEAPEREEGIVVKVKKANGRKKESLKRSSLLQFLQDQPCLKQKSTESSPRPPRNSLQLKPEKPEVGGTGPSGTAAFDSVAAAATSPNGALGRVKSGPGIARSSAVGLGAVGGSLVPEETAAIDRVAKFKKPLPASGKTQGLSAKALPSALEQQSDAPGKKTQSTRQRRQPNVSAEGQTSKDMKHEFQVPADEGEPLLGVDELQPLQSTIEQHQTKITQLETENEQIRDDLAKTKEKLRDTELERKQLKVAPYTMPPRQKLS
eukprot:GHVT01088413.1.p1 GENE.GHVT01088413.1~~GHVT01088413.1.p1  ORF type:complete len:636 (+),score=103.81 GHVT01088413.1:278-2185(+)